MGIVWIVVIGFAAGIIARLLSRGPNKPSGFVITTVLGIVGAFAATFMVRPWAGIDRTRAPASSPRRWAPSWCSSSGTASPPPARRRSGPTKVIDDGIAAI